MIISLLALLGLAAILSGFAIITAITLALFFKKQVCFHEKHKLILVVELFLDICGWFFIYLVLSRVIGGI